MKEQNDKEVVELALLAGHILLENGAEIFRVEETMERICAHFGVESASEFVLSNGIFVTVGNERENVFAKVQHIPVSGTHLDKVAAVNQLSREISRDVYTVPEAMKKLEEIQNMPGKSTWVQILASGVGSAAFCFLFGGNFRDSMAAFVAGFVLYIYVLGAGAHLSKIVTNILGGALVTVICGGFYLCGLGQHLNFMIVGSIMPSGSGSGVYQCHPGCGGCGLYFRNGAYAGCPAGIFLRCSRSGIWNFHYEPSDRRCTALISEFIAGMLGTMAFSILFGVPSRYYVYCGLIGSGGWIIYSAAVKVLGWQKHLCLPLWR